MSFRAHTGTALSMAMYAVATDLCVVFAEIPLV
jgi:hypothetical protein